MSAQYDLLGACALAIERRESAGWSAAEQARLALAAAHPPLEIPADWTQRFRLDEVDLALLQVALAPEADQGFHLLLGLLSGDGTPGRPTVALAMELAGLSGVDPTWLLRLAPSSSLVRYRLLVVDGSAPLSARRLRVPDRVAAQLRGDDLPDPAILGLLIEPTPMRLSGTERLATALAAGEQLVWVHSAGGGAGVAMSAGACHLLALPPLVADLRRLPVQARTAETDTPSDLGPDRTLVADLVGRLIDEAALTGSLLVLAGAELATAELPTMLQAAMPIIAVSQKTWDPVWSNRLPVSVAAPRLSVAEREALWARMLPDQQVPREVVALRLTPEQIHQVATAAGESASLDGLSEPGLAHLQAAARRFGRGQHTPGGGVSIADLVLPDHARGEVLRLLDWARYRDDVAAQGSLYGKGGKGTGICALFAGSPGTGKTLAAHVVADSLGIDLIQVELNSVVSKYLGESEKNLERVFQEAESLNAVLFFDEADALFGSRSNIKDSHDRYANQEVAYLLQRMESFDGITVLATNLRGNLDPAFARRLHFIVTFPDPDAETRAKLWIHHLAAVGHLDDTDPIDYDELARTAELSGGDIRNIVLAAVYDSVARQESLGRRHIAVALSRELGRLGRRVPAVSWLTDAGRQPSPSTASFSDTATG